MLCLSEGLRKKYQTYVPRNFVEERNVGRERTHGGSRQRGRYLSLYLKTRFPTDFQRNNKWIYIKKSGLFRELFMNVEFDVA